jgi:hypothetical protein
MLNAKCFYIWLFAVCILLNYLSINYVNCKYLTYIYDKINSGKLSANLFDTRVSEEIGRKEVKMKLGFILLLEYLIQKYKNKVPELEILELYFYTLTV